MKPVVAFDLDEVLCSLTRGVRAAIKRRCGVDVPDQRSSYQIHDRLGMTEQEFLQMIVEECLLEQATIEPYAAECVETLRRAGFAVGVVTSRSYHPHAEHVTREYFDRHGIEIDALRISTVGQSKAEHLVSLGPVVAFIDDLPENLQKVQAGGFLGALWLNDKPWNRLCAQYARITDLRDFARFAQLGSTPVAFAA
jgi:5'(3')-deoxyribonucleotidase